MSIHKTVDTVPTEAATCCPMCLNPFTAARANQTYCTTHCQKRFSRNATRGPRKVTESPAAARTYEARTGRIRGLSHALYETPPAYRSAFLQRLIGGARGNAELCRLVTVRHLLRSWERDEGTGRLHIAHVLDHFCREVYGLRSVEPRQRPAPGG